MDYSKQEKFHALQNSRENLERKTVAIVGLGGLGSHSSEYLARMGIGHIVLIDDDMVEESNLPRQGLFTHEDSIHHRLKGEVIKKRLEEINLSLSITLHTTRLTSQNAHRLLHGVDLVLDGSDNLHTRYLINDVCFQQNIPWIYTSATTSIGTLINFIPGKTPCFRCVFGEVEEDDASCDRDGVILPILTLMTSFQVTECLKILLDQNPSLDELRYDIWTRHESTVPLHIFDDEDCVCKQPKREQKQEQKMYLICSGDTVQANTSYSIEEMQERFVQWGFPIKQKNHVLVETITLDKKRIVGFKTGKIIFHHMEKETVLGLF